MDSASPGKSLSTDGFRYTLASGLIALIDVGAAWTCYELIGLPLAASAAIGVLIGGVAAYLVHEFWTFRRADAAFSARRLAGVFGLVILTLVLRAMAVALLEAGFPQDWAALPILTVALGMTFTVNFLINRTVIFRKP